MTISKQKFQLRTSIESASCASGSKVEKETGVTLNTKVLKIILPTRYVLLSWDIGFSIGEIHIKTMTGLHYNWAVFGKRIGASIAFSLVLGAIGYTVALTVDSVVQEIALRRK